MFNTTILANQTIKRKKMKKVFLIFALTILGIVNAQKGTILVAGSMGFGFEKDSNNINDSNSKNNYFTVAPKVGYQFDEKWTVGLQTRFFNGKVVNYNSIDGITATSKTNSYTLGPFVRYTKKLSDLFSVYGDLDALYGFSKSKNYNTQNENVSTVKGGEFRTTLTPAVLLNIKNNFGLSFSIGGVSYSNSSTKQDDLDFENRNNNFVFDFGQVFNIGIQKNF